MKRQFFNALLCGAVILSAAFFSACKDDNGNLDSRLTALELKVGQIQASLDNALASGSMISKYSVDEETGTHSFTFSGGALNGQTIYIEPGSGGGSSISIDTTSQPGFVVITVNRVPYRIPMGSAVNSLIYRPQYTDGIVVLGNADPKTNAGAVVKFLATPALDAAALNNATFDVADIYKVAARPSTRVGSGGLLAVRGSATIDGDGYVNVPVKGIGVEAGATYSVAIQMTLNGTTISSNYFTMEVADNFSFEAVKLDPNITLKSDYSPVAAGDATQITVNGLQLLDGTITDFRSLFNDGVLPAGAEFAVAPASDQPEGPARDKRGMLNSSLKADGSFAWSERPGTAFNDNATRKGFLFNIVTNDQINAKVYVTIVDDLADVDFKGGINGSAEAEYGGRRMGLPLGASTINILPTFTSFGAEGSADGDQDWEFIHGGRDDFFANWPNLVVSFADGDLVYNDGGKLVTTEAAEKYTFKSRGLYWFCRGFDVRVPEPLATDDGKYTMPDGSTVDGGELYNKLDFWWDDWADPAYGGNAMIPQAAQRGISISPDGVLSFPASYTGWGMRLAIGAAFEYAYGNKRIGGGDQFGLFFFNRRWAPEGTTMPPVQ